MRLPASGRFRHSPASRWRRFAADGVLMLAAACTAAVASAQTEGAPPLNDPIAARVITLAPHATEIVHAAGGGAYLVGTVSSSDFPAAVRDLPRVGDGITLNQERIIVLQPTLLVGWLRSGVALQIESLAGNLGARMIYARPESMRQIPAEVRRIGGLLGTQAIADPAARAMEARIDALEIRYAGRPPVGVFIEVGSRPLYTIGADPLLNDALRLCGAVNLYADTGIPAPRVPVESVLVQNPQLILATGDEAEIRNRWSGYGLPAAREGHIHIADPDALFRPGPRLIDAAEAICAAIDATR